MLTYSESLTNTTLVFWLGSIAWLAARSPFALKSLISISIAASLIALTRPQLLIFVLPTQLVILTWWWRTNRRALPALGAAVSILPFMAFAVYRVQLVTEISLFKMRYALNNLVGKNDSFREYALAEMPPCDLVPQALNGPAPWNDTQALGDPMINACPETWIWFRSDAVNMQQWMLSRPSATLAEFATQVNNVVLPLAPPRNGHANISESITTKRQRTIDLGCGVPRCWNLLRILGWCPAKSHAACRNRPYSDCSFGLHASLIRLGCRR